jgi:hypothetical protein
MEKTADDHPHEWNCTGLHCTFLVPYLGSLSSHFPTAPHKSTASACLVLQVFENRGYQIRYQILYLVLMEDIFVEYQPV